MFNSYEMWELERIRKMLGQKMVFRELWRVYYSDGDSICDEVFFENEALAKAYQDALNKANPDDYCSKGDVYFVVPTNLKTLWAAKHLDSRYENINYFETREEAIAWIKKYDNQRFYCIEEVPYE